MNAPKNARLTLAGTALCALLLGGLLFAVSEEQTVYFVNALDLPVVVTVDGGRTHTVLAGGRVSQSLTSGVHHVEVKTAEGQALEQGSLYVKSSSDRAVVWNVLGAAPLYVQSHVYTRHSKQSARPSLLTYAGARLVDRENVDYLFSNPPSSISTKDNSGRAIVKLQLAMAPGGWRTSLNILEGDGSYALLAKLGEALLQVDPRQQDAFDAALKGWHRAEGTEAALGFLRRTMKAHPGMLTAHAHYQQLLQSLGQREHLRSFYGGLVEKSPEAALLQYFLAQVEPPAEGLARLEKLVEQHPGETLYRRERARLRFLTGRYADAVADYDAAVDAEQPVEPHAASAYVRSLLALEQAPAALAMAARFGEAGPKMDWRLALLYGRVGRFVAKNDWPKGLDFFVNRASAGRSDRVVSIWIAARLGEEVSEEDLRSLPSEEMRQAIVIHGTAWMSVEDAWMACSTASPSALEMLDTTTALLLAAEFERAGDTVLAGRLFDTLALHVPLSREELRAAVFAPGGEAVLAHLDPEWRAAVRVARARRMDSQGLDSRATYAAVVRDDLFRGLVSRASRKWTRPTRGARASEKGVLRLVTPRAEAVSDGAAR